MRPAYSYQTLPSKMRCSALVTSLPRFRDSEAKSKINTSIHAPAPPTPVSRPPRPTVSRSLSLSQPSSPLQLSRPRREEGSLRRMTRSQSVYSMQEKPTTTLPFGSCASCGSQSWKPEEEEEELPKPEPSPLSALGYNSIKSRSLLSLNQASLTNHSKPLVWPLSRNRYSSTGHLVPSTVPSPANPQPHANILSKSHRTSSARNLILLNEVYQDCKFPSHHLSESQRQAIVLESITDESLSQWKPNTAIPFCSGTST